MILPFFSPPLPGELLYSALARHGILRGLSSPKAVMAELFGRPSAIATMDLPNGLAPLFSRVPAWRGKEDDIIGGHTLFRYYTAFQPAERRHAAREAMMGTSGSLHFTLGVSTFRTGRPTHLQFCPACHDHMEADHGFLHWRVEHQLPGVLVCARHGIPLRRSRVRLSAANRHAYVPASRDACPKDCDLLAPSLQGRSLDLAIELSRVSAALLEKPLPARTREERRDWYRSRLSSIGLVRGRHNIQQTLLQQVFTAYFGELLSRLDGVDLAAGSETWLNSIVRFSSGAHPPLQHLLLQMFLDASTDRLDDDVLSRISKCIILDPSAYSGSSGCGASDWRGVDRDYSIEIRKRAHLLRRVSPPVRITPASIEKGLKGRDWLSKRRSKLPVSDRAIREVTEGVEKFRARRMRWHVRACVSEGIFDPWIVMRRAGLPPGFIKTVRSEFDLERQSPAVAALPV